MTKNPVSRRLFEHLMATMQRLVALGVRRDAGAEEGLRASLDNYNVKHDESYPVSHKRNAEQECRYTM